MTCELCDIEIEVEKEISIKKEEDITEDDWFHNIAGFTVCKTCHNKVTTFFRDLVKKK